MFTLRVHILQCQIPEASFAYVCPERAEMPVEASLPEADSDTC